MALLERIKIILRSPRTGNQLPVFINVENSLNTYVIKLTAVLLP